MFEENIIVKKRVFIGMSGGVDSSVAAALLQKRGYDVTGVTFQLSGVETAEGCCGWETIRDAKLICGKLGIPHYVLNYKDIFQEKVIDVFVQETLNGQTTNPCVTCNRDIKFGAFLAWSLSNGADLVASGHYAKIVYQDNIPFLAAAADKSKDQSYFLHQLTTDQLKYIDFPLGDLIKKEVRKIAEEMNLHVAQKKESQGMCFARGNYTDYTNQLFQQYMGEGEIITTDGKVIGKHRGALSYTIGQKRGGLIYYRGTKSPDVLRVIGKNIEKNQLIVGHKDTIQVNAHHIIGGKFRGNLNNNIFAVNRYHGEPIPVDNIVRTSDDIFHITLKENVALTAPGQSVVLYENNMVVGGGISI